MTNSGTKNGTLEYVEPAKKSVATIVIPTTVKIDGITYKVTAIAEGAFKNCKKLKKVSIGNNVKTIGVSAFSGCEKLKTVVIGKNVTIINAKAFYKCIALTQIIIPSKVTHIDEETFSGCKKLSKVTIKGALLENIGENVFKGISKKAIIKCPKQQLKKYKKLFKSNTGYKKTMKIK